MGTFVGFPEKMEYTGVPKQFISEVLPQIDDMAELKVSLFLFRLLNEKRGRLRFVSYGELSENRSLVSGLLAQATACGGSPVDVLKGGLEAAVARGTFTRLTAAAVSYKEDIYVLNTPKNRELMEEFHKGDLAVSIKGRPSRVMQPPEIAPRPDIFSLYERAIGPVGSDIIADQLRDAENLYPSEWIEDAFKEAVSLNHRSWRYIETILKRWMEEGRESGESERRPRTARELEEAFRRQYERSREKT